MRSLYFVPVNAILTAASPSFSVVVGGTTTLPITSTTTQADTTSGNSTFNLPAASAAGRRCRHTLLKKVPDNAILVVPNGTDTIQGVNAVFPMAGDFSGITFQSDGAGGWWIVP